MKISFTKKPMKPITINPSAVRTVILLNSGPPGRSRSGWPEMIAGNCKQSQHLLARKALNANLCGQA